MRLTLKVCAEKGEEFEKRFHKCNFEILHFPLYFQILQKKDSMGA